MCQGDEREVAGAEQCVNTVLASRENCPLIDVTLVSNFAGVDRRGLVQHNCTCCVHRGRGKIVPECSQRRRYRVPDAVLCQQRFDRCVTRQIRAEGAARNDVGKDEQANFRSIVSRDNHVLGQWCQRRNGVHSQASHAHPGSRRQLEVFRHAAVEDQAAFGCFKTNRITDAIEAFCVKMPRLPGPQLLDFRRSTRMFLVSAAFLIVLSAPVLVCAYVFNLVPPYSGSPPPMWTNFLLYAWLCGSLGPLTVAALLGLVRCPQCERFMLLRDSRFNTSWQSQLALLQAYRRNRIHCHRCGLVSPLI